MTSSIERAQALLAANDARDAAAVAAAFYPEGLLRFANFPTVSGRAAIEESLASFFATLSNVSHEVIGVTTGSWGYGEVVSLEAEVTYTRHNGEEVGPLPVTSTIRFVNGLQVASYRIYMDPSPLTRPDVRTGA